MKQAFALLLAIFIFFSLGQAVSAAPEGCEFLSNQGCGPSNGCAANLTRNCYNNCPGQDKAVCFCESDSACASSGGSNKSGGSSGLTNIDAEARKLFPVKTIDDFLPNLVQVIFILGTVIALVFVFWGGISYISAGGDKEATKKAQERITHTIVGLAILSSIWVIWRLVVYFLGLSSSATGGFQIPIPSL
jgi:hypothetical protein